MEKYIKDYLLKYGRVQVSDFGTFEVTYKASQIHPILHTFSVPGKYVVFLESKKQDDDFAFFVARKEKITFEEAKIRIENWVQEVWKTVKEDKKQFSVSSLGSFFINAMGRIEFAAVLDTDISPQSFGLEEFKAKLPVHVKTKGEMDKMDKMGETDKTDKIEETVEIAEDLPSEKKKKRVGWWFLLFFSLACGLFIWVVHIAFPQTFDTYKDKALELFDEAKAKFTKNAPDVLPLEAIDNTETTENEEQIIESEPMEIAEEVPQEESQPTAAIQTDNYYYVIIGSFRTSANADKFLQEKQTNYSNAVHLGMGKSGYYLIGIGPYSQQEAESKRKEISNAWIFVKK